MASREAFVQLRHGWHSKQVQSAPQHVKGDEGHDQFQRQPECFLAHNAEHMQPAADAERGRQAAIRSTLLVHAAEPVCVNWPSGRKRER